MQGNGQNPYSDLLKLAHDAEMAHATGDTRQEALLRQRLAKAVRWMDSSRLPEEPRLVTLRDVTPKPVRYLWAPYIPFGTLSIIEGDPGAGKSHVLCAIASAVSNGGSLPGQSDCEHVRCERGRVLFLSDEDELSVNRERCEAAGADLSNIVFFDEDEIVITLKNEAYIDAALGTVKPAMLAVDPVTAYLGDVDSSSPTEGTSVMKRLRALCRKHGCAGVVTRHLGKDGKRKTIYRGLGSISSFSGVARSMLQIASDPDDDERRGLFHEKYQYVRRGRALGFTIAEEGRGSFVRWTGSTSLTPEIAARGRGEKSAAEALEDGLRVALKAGPRLVAELIDEMEATKDALGKARRKIGAPRVKLAKDESPTGKSAWIAGRPGQSEADARAEFLRRYGPQTAGEGSASAVRGTKTIDPSP